MMKLIYQATFFVVFVLGTVSLSGQPSAPGAQGSAKMSLPKVIGKIIDEESGIPLEFAAISLLNAEDSTLVSGGITDLDGKFEIEAKEGIYLLKLEYIAFETIWLPSVSLGNGKRISDLGEIRMHPNSQMLDEVEVIAEKSTLQMGLDKKIFNVGKDLANRGTNAADILDNIPSITVDLEGEVSLRGSGNVRILIDGKPSGLVGVGNALGLQSLQGSMIDRVEIITNPSAKYEAEGMSGIINIILKKEQQKGLNGVLDANVGVPGKYGAGVNVNYRKSDVNLFAQYGFNKSETPGGGFSNQEYYGENGTEYLDQVQDRNRDRTSHTVRAGMDFFLNEKNILTASGMYRYSISDNNSLVTYRDFNNARELTGIAERTETSSEIDPNLEFDITYKKEFKKKDQRLTFDIQYSEGEETQNSIYDELDFLPDYTPILDNQQQQRSDNIEGNSNFLVQLDYEEPLWKDGKIEFGYRGSFRNIRNKYLVEDYIDQEWTRIASLSNDFNYDENIHATYVTLGNKFNKFSVQGGLRWELSDVTTLLKDTNEENARNYNNFFPSMFVGYELNEGNQIQVSYSRRVRRPRFHYLNPFFSFSDPRNIYGGNPNLDPEFTDSYEIGHIKYWENASLGSSIYYRYSTGVISRIRTVTVNDDGSITTIRRPENLDSEDSYGLEFTFNFGVKKWWDINGSLNTFRQVLNAGALGADLNASGYSMSTRVTNKWKIGKKLEAQSRFNYRAPQTTSQGKRKSMIFADLALSYDVMKGNGTLNFSVNDLFNSRKYRYEDSFDNFYSVGEFQWRRSRQYTLSLNYRINQKKQRKRGGEGGDFEGGEMEF